MGKNAYTRHPNLPPPYCSKSPGIYAILNRNNGKIYVGSAMKLNKRWNVHRYDLWKGRHNPYFLRAFRREPDAFYIEIIEEMPGSSKETRLAREQFWINFFQSFIPKNGYNICKTAGSCEGIKHPPEYGEAISKRQKGIKWSDDKKSIWRATRKVPRGWKWSTEARIKMSNKKRGIKWSESQREGRERWAKLNDPWGKPVIQCDLDGSVVNEFKSIAEAERYLGIKRSNISGACNGKRPTCLGWKWKYKTQ